MNRLAITQNEPITYGDVIVVLAILALISVCLWSWRR